MIKKVFIFTIIIAAIGGAGYYYDIKPDDLKDLWARLNTLADDYYSRAQNKTLTTANNAGRQTSPSIMVQGNAVTLDAKARQLSGVQTARARIRALTRDIQAAGKIAMNENSRTYITSRVEGRVDKLFITAEGEYVAPGRAIASVYSPGYIAAQEEYLLTVENVEKLKNAGKDVVQINNRLRDAARKKLKLLNVADRDIANLEKNRQPEDNMTIYAQFGGTVLERQVLPGAYIRPGDKLYSLVDLSKVWLYVDIYERDLAGIKSGQTVNATSLAYPEEIFTGTVSFISPVLDDATRTIKVRVEMPNPKGKLKLNMFVTANLQIPLGERLIIPESALLDTGVYTVSI
jgi:Cu(I)/Ag(I) efflux system membrane fusion protein